MKCINLNNVVESGVFVNFCFLVLGVLSFFSIVAADEITPHKFTDIEMSNGINYHIPESSRFIIERGLDSSKIIYYASFPQTTNFPIAILCGGSSLEHQVSSIVHFHRYFLKEFLDLGIAVLTVEQQGVDGNRVDVKEFMKNYTRSNRLYDHRRVIESLKEQPPSGWNGKLVFLGVSEGGPLVTTLTTDYSDITLATINWSGAGDYSWDLELWEFIQDFRANAPWYIQFLLALPRWVPFVPYIPKEKVEYEVIINEIINNPTPDLKFFGMTYQYHADALKYYPCPEYEKITTPYLVVAGAYDSFVKSSDAFVEKALLAGCSLTYMRISNMDHFVRKREDVIQNSFAWLNEVLTPHI